MRPAIRADAVAVAYLTGLAAAAVAGLRVLDPAIHSDDDDAVGEAVGWLVAFGLTTGIALAAAWLTDREAACECQFTGQPVACQSQRNAAAVSAAMACIHGLLLLLTLLAVTKVTRLADVLATAAALAGPVATVWYGASVVEYPIRLRPPPPPPPT